MSTKHVTNDAQGDKFQRQISTKPPFKLVGKLRSIHFLRGVFSRATFCLPAYYYCLGAASAPDESSSADYPSVVARTYSRFADLNALTLSCRKVFDHALKPDLTGGNFGKISDSVIIEHARYWGKDNIQGQEDATIALKFLRRFFSECSLTPTLLLQSDTLLQRRIGLLKQHADRSAAHLSLESYELDIVDLTHFVASLVVVGEIVRSFDRPDLGDDYFENLDSAAYIAAKRTFPDITAFQIFPNWGIARQARIYWNNGDTVGLPMLFNQIQNAIGGDPSERG